MMRLTKVSLSALQRFVMLSFMGAMFVTPVLAQQSQDTARLYAAYTFNLMSFTQWPNLPQDKLSLCLAGENRDTQLLSLLNGRLVQGVPIEVISYHPLMPLETCQVMFVASAEYADLFDRATRLPLLLLTNIMPDNGRSAMVTLATDSGRVVFDVDLRLVKQVGVNLPSNLLKLARRVNT